MTAPDWNALAREIAEEIWRSEQRIVLTYFLEESLVRRNLPVQGQVAEKFDGLKKRVLTEIQKKIQSSSERRVQPRFRTTGDPDVLIPLVNRASERIRREIVSTVGGLSTRQFECFCVQVLSVDGVDPCDVGIGKKEEGIDLYGILDIGKIKESSVWHGVEVRILGQAKTSAIGQPTVRLFHTDLNTCAKGEGRAFKLAPTWFKQSRAPVLGMMMSRKKFTGGAAKWAAREAIVTKDLEQMVEDLVRSPNMTLGIRGSAENLEFDKEMFIDHLKKIDTH